MAELRINFGCEDIMPGFVNCNIKPLETVKYVCNAWEIESLVEPASVEEIISEHMFEHLTFAQGKLTLQAWFNILKPGCKATMRLPDLEFHVRQYLECKDRTAPAELTATCDTEFEHVLAGFWGWQREQSNEPIFSAIETTWDIHKSGYDYELLSRIVTQCGFQRIQRLSSSVQDLTVEFWR